VDYRANIAENLGFAKFKKRKSISLKISLRGLVQQ
jgi:hypothetical protein